MLRGLFMHSRSTIYIIPMHARTRQRHDHCVRADLLFKSDRAKSPAGHAARHVTRRIIKVDHGHKSDAVRCNNGMTRAIVYSR
jgi:hypothetical protein